MRQSALLEGQQLQSARRGSAGCARPAPTCRPGSQAMGNPRAAAVLAAALWREQELAERVPYSAQLTEHVLRTTSADYVQVFRLAGASFESADDEQLNNWHERLNVLWRNIASPNVALWTHVIRRREATPWGDAGAAGFAAALLDKYR